MKVKLEVKTPYTNVIDAVTHGAGDGMTVNAYEATEVSPGS